MASSDFMAAFNEEMKRLASKPTPKFSPASIVSQPRPQMTTRTVAEEGMGSETVIYDASDTPERTPLPVF